MIFYPGTHAPVQTDVAVINPCAPCRLRASRYGHRWASKTKKAEKTRKYRPNAVAMGDIFRPLIFETHGKMADEITMTLDMLASRTPMSRGLAANDMKLDLAITLARGNALAARTTIARAQRARDASRTVYPASGDNCCSHSRNRSRSNNTRSCSSSSSSSAVAAAAAE